MTSWMTRTALVLVLLAPVADADQARRAKPQRAEPTAQPDTSKARFISARDLEFVAAPPVLPKGAQIAVLHGDPMKPGMFTVRLRAPNGYRIPPHWHTQDEQLTVVSGTLLLYMGDTMKSEPHAMTAGDFHFLPGNMRHAAQAKGETIVQITGWGPFDIHYVNPADNPQQSTARR